MSLEKADHRRKAAGYDGHIVTVIALKRNNTEATTRLRYWFRLLDQSTSARDRKVILMDARTGNMTLVD